MTGLPVAALLWLLTLTLVAACLRWDDDENDGTVDEDGWQRVPGEDVREVGLP